MVGVEQIDGGPRSVIAVGAGIVGLSTAWFLQERGVDHRSAPPSKAPCCGERRTYSLPSGAALTVTLLKAVF